MKESTSITILASRAMSNTLVVCHDAGAAMLLSHWLKDEQSEILYAVYGPAREIFSCQSVNISPKKLEELFELNKFDRVITGTGWMTNIEVCAIKYAVNRNIYCISAIDHWVNYNQRFLLDNNYYYPNEIWVGDSYAYQHARLMFQSSIKICQKNSALQEMVDTLISSKIGKDSTNQRSLQTKRVLIAMEPIRKIWKLKKTEYPPEIEGLFWLKENLRCFISYLGHEFNYEFKLRRHPSEKRNKYKDCLKEINKETQFKFELSEETDVLEDIYASDIILGFETQALVIGLMMNKRVFSMLPPWAPPCDLPHKEIIHLKKLL